MAAKDAVINALKQKEGELKGKEEVIANLKININ